MVRYKGTSISFTGHRPSKLGGYDETSKRIIAIKRELKHKICDAIQLGYQTFISGMAMGVDTWAAEIVLEYKKDYDDLQLVCAVPFTGQEMRWHEDTKKRYWKILDSADEINIVSDGGYSPEKMQTRNEWMVDNSGLVISVWDGTSGGTGNCVRYVKKQKTKMWTIDPKDFQ